MLTRLYVRVKSAMESDTGATALEYGMLVALIAIIIAVAVAAFGTNLKDFFQEVADTIGGW